MNYKSVMATVAVAASVFSAPAFAAFQYTSHSSYINETTWDITFTTTFNQAPDFTTVDDYGRLANAFQINIFSNATTTSFADLSTLVRGTEIDLVSNLIPVRDGVIRGSSEPGSGGWGPIVGYIPFTWNASTNTLTFIAPDWLLNASTPYFKYELITTEYGRGTRSDYFTTAVPEPTSLALLLSGLGILGLRRKLAK